MFRFISREEVASFISDGDCVAVNGFLILSNPVELQEAIADSFEKTGHPRELDLLTASGCGCWDQEHGIDRCAGLGMLRSIITSHFTTMPRIAQLVAENKIEGYNFPLGVISASIRAAAGGMSGLLSKTGLGIFVDPRQQGPALNQRSRRQLVEVTELGGEEFLYYKTPKIDVAFLRGTSVDPKGNITFEKEFVAADALIMAQATKANGGKVIVQVEKVRSDFDRPRSVVIPGILVDAVVVVRPPQSRVDEEDAKALSGQVHVPSSHMDYWMGRISLSGGRGSEAPNPVHYLISKRAARELRVGDIVNIGIGIPEFVGKRASESGILRDLTLTVESGGIGGLPAPGVTFGAMIGADFVCEMVQQFDFYDGGGLDICFMGGLEVDRFGNVNAHYLPGRCIGIGGFANITQSTGTVVFCVTFTASGLEVKEDGGRVTVVREGRSKKFLREIGQISFSAAQAIAKGQRVLYVTERCVFQLTSEGLALVEVSPGIDKQKQIFDLLDFPVVDLV